MKTTYANKQMTPDEMVQVVVFHGRDGTITLAEVSKTDIKGGNRYRIPRSLLDRYLACRVEDQIIREAIIGELSK